MSLTVTPLRGEDPFYSRKYENKIEARIVAMLVQICLVLFN